MAGATRTIDGTTIFDSRQARRGRALNAMCYSLNDATNRAAFGEDAEAYMARHGLDDEQRSAVRRGDVLAMIEAGGSIYYLAKLAAVAGWDVQDIGAQQTGLTKAEFVRRLLDAGN